MWLTGFDAPPVHIMHGHNLMQAIARVNRVFKDKPSGIIVDYIGIGDRLKDATNKYTRGDGCGEVTVDIEAAFEEIKEQVDRIIDNYHKNVTRAVRKNLQLDWHKKENARAAIRLAVKKELRGKVDIKELSKILAEIMEQAEGQYKEWPMAG